MRPERFTRLAALPVAMVMLAGCVHQKSPSVGIQPLNADIVFGVKPPAATTEPANFGNTTPAAVAAEPEIDLLPPQIEDVPQPKNFPRPVFTAPTVSTECPAAAQNAFPEESAPLNVPDKSKFPKMGTYRWKRSGSYDVSGATAQVKGFEQRTLQNLQIESDDPARLQYSFEMVQPEVGSDAVVTTTFHVDTAATSRAVFSPADNTQISGGAPERGLVIRSIVRKSKDGSTTSFEANPGLLIAPLPIRVGEHFQSIAIDPKSQQTMRFTGDTIDRDRVDACGEILEGWRINGQLDIGGSSTETKTYSIIVSPQFGMQLIDEHVEGPVGLGTGKLDFSVGQKLPAAPTS